MCLRLTKSKIDMGNEYFIICKMVIGWKEGHKPVWIGLPHARHAIGYGRRGSVAVRLDEEARRRHSRDLASIITLVRSRHEQKCVLPEYHPAHPPPGLLQERFAAGQCAELLGSVVTGDCSGQGKEPL